MPPRQPARAGHSHIRAVLFACVALAAAAGAACSGTDSPVTPTPTPTDRTPIQFSGGTVSALVAATAATRETGLMGRLTMAADSGMLFVFLFDQQPELVAFWMKGTALPLSIAFLDASKRVLAVQDMTPFDTVTLHRPATPFRYALEVNRGWFASHGVLAGATATFTLPTGLVITP